MDSHSGQYIGRLLDEREAYERRAFSHSGKSIGQIMDEQEAYERKNEEVIEAQEAIAKGWTPTDRPSTGWGDDDEDSFSGMMPAAVQRFLPPTTQAPIGWEVSQLKERRAAERAGVTGVSQYPMERGAFVKPVQAVAGKRAALTGNGEMMSAEQVSVLMDRQQATFQEMLQRIDHANANERANLQRLFEMGQRGQQMQHHIASQNQAMSFLQAQNAQLVARMQAMQQPRALPAPVTQHPNVQQRHAAPITNPYARQNAQYEDTPYTPTPLPSRLRLQTKEKAADSNDAKHDIVKVYANPCDDVFAPQQTHSQTPAGLQYLFAMNDFDSKGYTELLNSCFSKVEASIRQMPIVAIANASKAGNRAAFDFIGRCQQFLMHRREAYVLLNNPNEKYFLLTGVANRLILDNVLLNGILTEFDCTYRAEFIYRYNAEADASTGQDSLDYAKRYHVAAQRAEMATIIVNLPGFWKFVQNYTAICLDSIVAPLEPAFPATHFRTFKDAMWRPVNEALRIGIRMLQDPRYFEFFCPRVGIPWDSRYQAHRNPELVGKQLSNDKSPYVVRCAIRPLVKVTNHDAENPMEEIIHRAEVIVSNQKNKYRPAESLQDADHKARRFRKPRGPR